MDLRKGLREAVKFYWQTRAKQSKSQGAVSGTKDYGNRSAVTGGAQADGFIKLVREILREHITRPVFFLPLPRFRHL